MDQHVTEPVTSLMRFGPAARRVQYAAADATVERFHVLQPQGHAFAVVISVREPHTFLRAHARPLVTVLGRWRGQCEGIYAEIRDGEPNPAMTIGWFQGGGSSSTRRDLECCAPFLGLGHPVDTAPPQPCPVFG
jgi:hypothetical protein